VVSAADTLITSLDIALMAMNLIILLPSALGGAVNKVTQAHTLISVRLV
jgi:hypothetical protein